MNIFFWVPQIIDSRTSLDWYEGGIIFIFGWIISLTRTTTKKARSTGFQTQMCFLLFGFRHLSSAVMFHLHFLLQHASIYYGVPKRTLIEIIILTLSRSGAKALHSCKKICVISRTFAFTCKLLCCITALVFPRETMCLLTKALTFAFVHKMFIFSKNTCVPLRNSAFTHKTFVFSGKTLPRETMHSCKTFFVVVVVLNIMWNIFNILY